VLQGFTRCAPCTTYTLPSSILVSETVLRPVSLLRSPSSSPEPFSIPVFSPVHRIRLQNRPPSRLRNRSPSRLPSPSFVLHPRLRNCSPFSFSALFTGFVTETVLHPRFQHCSPDSSPEPFSVPSSSFVLHPRLPPSSSIPVTVAVLHPRFQPPCFFGDVTKNMCK